MRAVETPLRYCALDEILQPRLERAGPSLQHPVLFGRSPGDLIAPPEPPKPVQILTPPNNPDQLPTTQPEQLAQQKRLGAPQVIVINDKRDVKKLLEYDEAGNITSITESVVE